MQCCTSCAEFVGTSVSRDYGPEAGGVFLRLVDLYRMDDGSPRLCFFIINGTLYSMYDF